MLWTSHLLERLAHASNDKLPAGSSKLSKDRMLEMNHFPALHEGMVSGAFSNGRDGELVAQVIIFLAFDKVCNAHREGLDDVVPCIWLSPSFCQTS